MHFSPCLEVAGTTTFANDAVAALADRKGLGERGYYEGQAQLQRNPEKPVDPHAVAVLVDGEKVGCLPSYAAKDLPLPAGAISAACAVGSEAARQRRSSGWVPASRNGPTPGTTRPP